MNPFIDNLLKSSGDAYAGLDHKVELTFHAHAEDEFVRKMPVHQVPSQGGTLQPLKVTMDVGFTQLYFRKKTSCE